MSANIRNWRLRHLASVVALLLLATVVLAAEERGRYAKIGEYNPNDQTIEMFAAMKKGDIAVKVIPKDSTQMQVLIENKTDKPLNVKLPDSFAAVPILAQIQGGQGGGRNHGSGGSNQSQNQSMGGGMGGMGGGGMGGGMFNVPAEQVGKFKVPTVCLEHGKAEPRAQIPYEIKPIDTFTTKPGVSELCQILGNGKIPQRAAQAAAWHLNNNMSWEVLTAKRLKHANGTSQPYFSQEEIQAGMQLAATAVRAAEERKTKETTPKTLSESQK